MINRIFFLLILCGIVVSSCSPTDSVLSDPVSIEKPILDSPKLTVTLMPTRIPYQPGELVDYIAQTGDTLPSIAAHFNTTVDQIRSANPIIPKDATTMPPGMPMKIPIYYLPLWGSSYQLIPDSLFVYGPQSLKLDVMRLVNANPGWLKSYSEPRPEGNLNIEQVLTQVSQHFSISPLVFIIFLEAKAHGLSDPKMPDTDYVLGYKAVSHKGVYMQLVWLANELNNGYYGWRSGDLKEIEFSDGSIERPDPWQNAATVAMQYALSINSDFQNYQSLVNPGGVDLVIKQYFGDVWSTDIPHIPGSITQPAFKLPFNAGEVWNFTGGPHTGWGEGQPYSAIDFAPSGVKGCGNTEDWTTAMADGKIIRSGNGEVLLDLDGDGSEQTGWVIFYLHISNTDRIQNGKIVKTGDHIGHPSCEGGTATGTHVHIARRFNGEWILTDSPIAFNLDGWVVKNGSRPYLGTMSKFSKTITASAKAVGFSAIEAEPDK